MATDPRTGRVGNGRAQRSMEDLVTAEDHAGWMARSRVFLMPIAAPSVRLTAIENRLRATDPRFAAMFRMLGDLSHRRKAPVWVFMSVWVARRGGAKLIILLATIVTLIAAFAAAAAVLA